MGGDTKEVFGLDEDTDTEFNSFASADSAWKQAVMRTILDFEVPDLPQADA